MPSSALLVFLLAGPADDARKQLASEVPRDQALGAHAVGEHQLETELPGVRALLVQHKEM